MDDARHSFHERRATRAIAPDGVTHTFTIHGLDLNVPIAAAQGQTAAVVSFTLHIDPVRDLSMGMHGPAGPGIGGHFRLHDRQHGCRLDRHRGGGYNASQNPSKSAGRDDLWWRGQTSEDSRCGRATLRGLSKQWNSTQRDCPAGDLGG